MYFCHFFFIIFNALFALSQRDVSNAIVSSKLWQHVSTVFLILKIHLWINNYWDFKKHCIAKQFKESNGKQTHMQLTVWPLTQLLFVCFFRKLFKMKCLQLKWYSKFFPLVRSFIFSTKVIICTTQASVHTTLIARKVRVNSKCSFHRAIGHDFSGNRFYWASHTVTTFTIFFVITVWHIVSCWAK